MFAADIGDVAITIQLMQLDADIDAADERGKTALHYATICEQIDVAEVLLEAGADPEARDANGKSASDLGVYELVKKKAKGELSSYRKRAVNDEKMKRRRRRRRRRRRFRLGRNRTSGFGENGGENVASRDTKIQLFVVHLSKLLLVPWYYYMYYVRYCMCNCVFRFLI